SRFVPLVDLVLLVLVFFDSSLSCHFRPFIGVLRKIFGSLTREVWEFLHTPRIARMTRMVLCWRPPRRTPTIGCGLGVPGRRALAIHPIHVIRGYFSLGHY